VIDESLIDILTLGALGYLAVGVALVLAFGERPLDRKENRKWFGKRNKSAR
jgi:hypothetical protein